MRWLGLLLIAVAACGGGSGDDGDDAPPADARPTPDAGPLVPGTIDIAWMHGQPDCEASIDPELQVLAYNTATYVIRQDKCRTFEAPFVYLLLGAEKAFLLDTGATPGPALREQVREIIGDRVLVVAHSHAHGDHTASDAQFEVVLDVQMIPASRSAIQAAFAITSWPFDPGVFELGGRTLDVLAIPGHEANHIAVYDRQTGLLLTGDSLYPGFLFVDAWDDYRASIHRLRQFAEAHPIAHILGAHIEMSSMPGVAYPYGTTYQPEEHVLQLGLAHLVELDDALIALGSTPAEQVHDDFVIDP
jgi:hydroxyacylglutathione hydrolase